jgi:hypothetical protein
MSPLPSLHNDDLVLTLKVIDDDGVGVGVNVTEGVIVGVTVGVGVGVSFGVCVILGVGVFDGSTVLPVNVASNKQEDPTLN